MAEMRLSAERFAFDQVWRSRIGAPADFGAQAPFPHVVVDELVPADVLRSVAAEFPDPDDPWWPTRFNEGTSKKLASNEVWRMGQETRNLLAEMNSTVFVSWLEQVTGIEGLIADPHLAGGGMHQIGAGGFLKVHADFNRHERLRLDRRLNVLLYLNEDWQDEWGGHLELWSSDMQRCERRVAPVLGRCVIFATTDWSYHGHPDPLTCPPGAARKSLALYYYTNGRPSEEVSESHSTLYQERPGERVRMKATAPQRLARKVRRWGERYGG